MAADEAVDMDVDLGDEAIDDTDDKRNKKKDKKGGKSEEKESTGSKILSALIILLIIIIWLAIFGVLIKYDVGGFGSTVLYPLLKDVPYVNRILPEVSDQQAAEENNYPYNNLTEAMDRINELEAELAAAKSTNGANANYVAGLQAEVNRLKTFEQNQLQFEAEKDAFDKEVVFNDKAPDTSEYQKYYEMIDPDNAAEIYRQVIEQQQVSAKIQAEADMYAAMKPAQAAAIFNGMSGDLDLVAELLSAMDTDTSGAILGAMDANMAEKVTKKMYVDAKNLYSGS